MTIPGEEGVTYEINIYFVTDGYKNPKLRNSILSAFTFVELVHVIRCSL